MWVGTCTSSSSACHRLGQINELPEGPTLVKHT
jgi:hypothetical protein